MTIPPPITEPSIEPLADTQPTLVALEEGELSTGQPVVTDVAPEPASAPVVPQPSSYQRFSLAQRLEHVLAIGSFTVLAVTGLPQEFAAHNWAQAMIGFLGGIEVTRNIHHFAAVVLMLEVVWHLVSLGYRLYVLRARPTMLPGVLDVTDAWGTFLYNVGLRKQRPLTGRYSFEEKVEYWAFVWGTVIMVITGFMMWNPIATANLLPGQFIPAAKIAHGQEALLAVLAISIWHLYSVHVRHFNRSMWTGKLSEQEMLAEHPLELAEIKSGAAERPQSAAGWRKRQRNYLPIAGVMSLALLAGIYAFVTFEKTAIDTVPLTIIREAQVQAYRPITPTPLPTPLVSPAPASLKPIWKGNIELVLANNCLMCHGGIAGLDFSSYASTLSGGQNGPTVLPGDADHSPLLQRIKDGTHPGKLIAAQLSKLKAWIAAGAPEQ